MYSLPWSVDCLVCGSVLKLCRFCRVYERVFTVVLELGVKRVHLVKSSDSCCLVFDRLNTVHCCIRSSTYVILCDN